MPSNRPSPADLVARFLSKHHYQETLEVFLKETGISHDLPSAKGLDDSDSAWTIEQLLEEKIAFDHAVSFERRDDAHRTGWRTPTPLSPTIVSSNPASNVLSASIQQFEGSVSGQALFVTTSGRRLSVVDPLTLDLLSPGSSKSFDSPILSCVSFLNGRLLATTNMAGKLLILEGKELSVVDEIRGHGKFAVMVAAYEEEKQDNTDGKGMMWLATAGWDARVLVYKLEYQDVEGVILTKLSESPTYELTLPTNPECIVITRDQDTENLVLVLSRKDSSYLEYYLLSSQSEASLHAGLIQLGRQNLAPQSNAWTPFSPAHFLISPKDPGLLAVATSSEPHMKVIIVRMLIPSSSEKDSTTNAPAQASAQNAETLPSDLANLSLQTQSREDSAINLQCTVPAPQTPYSTPQLAWRPDGSGLWVNGDDGVVRGIDVETGEVVTGLGAGEKGHELGSKIRCIWSGLVAKETGEVEEWVVSGGFDKKVIVWKAN